MTFDFIQSVRPYDPKALEREPGSKYYSIVGRKIGLLMRCLNAFGYSHSGIYRQIFGFPSEQRPFYDSWKHVFVDKNAMEYEKRMILEKMAQDPQYPIKAAQKCEELGEDLYAYSKELKKTDFSGKTDDKLKAYAQSLFERVAMHNSFLLFPLSLQRHLEETLTLSLGQKIAEAKTRDDYYLVLTTPIKPNWGYFEQRTIMRLAQAYRSDGQITPKTEKEIQAYLFEYDHQGTKYGYGELWNRQGVIERLDYLKSQGDLDQKVEHLENLPGFQTGEVERVLAAVGADQELKDLVDLTRTYVYLRTYRTDVLSAAFANAFGLYGEIGKRHGLTYQDVTECLPNEVLTFRFPDQATIRERAQASIVRGKDGELYYAVGDEAKKICDSILGQNQAAAQQATTTTSEAVKGNIANPGIAHGIVRVVMDNTELAKVKPGDVLVAVMTTPDFVPAMEKAAAFVTDEGGILCHAAIVSREMGKPCIIGTKIATKVLKDGDEVEVDADKGTIKILKRA